MEQQVSTYYRITEARLKSSRKSNMELFCKNSKRLKANFFFFFQKTVSLLLPFVYQVEPYFMNSIDICSTNQITETGIYIQKKSIKKIFFLWKGYFFFVIFLVFNEKITFKHFLFTNITKFRFLLFFTDHTDIKKWKFKIFWRLWRLLKACVHYFLSNFYFFTKW